MFEQTICNAVAVVVCPVERFIELWEEAGLQDSCGIKQCEEKERKTERIRGERGERGEQEESITPFCSSGSCILQQKGKRGGC